MAKIKNKLLTLFPRGGRYALAQLMEALRYKPKGRGFDSRWESL